MSSIVTGARYARLLEVIRKVLKIYNFKEIRVNDNLEANCNLFYLTTDSLVIKTTKVLNPVNISNVLLAGTSILKGLGLKKFNIVAKEDSNINKIISDCQIDIIIDDIDSLFWINFNDFVAKFNNNELVFNLDSLLDANKESGKSLVVPLVLHTLFIAEDDKCMLEIIKAMNICRIGGLISEAIYNDEDTNENALFVCYLDDNGLSEKKINIIDTKTNLEEVISISDVYPYIINKLNKNSACMSCKEGK